MGQNITTLNSEKLSSNVFLNMAFPFDSVFKEKVDVLLY